MPVSEPIQRNALYLDVADRLRRAIYSHQLQPGDAIDEKALCASFGISRTPLREALKVLASEGLVELVPRRGCFVRKLTLAELNDLFPVMAVLEGLCAREALRHLDETQLAELEGLHEQLEAEAAAGDIDAYYETNFVFHKAVEDLSGNRCLQRVITDLRKVLRLARHAQLTLPGRLQQSLQEHRRIMAAFRRRDPDEVDRCMQDHLNQQWQALAEMSVPEPAAMDNKTI